MRKLFKVIQEFRERLIDIETKVEKNEFSPYFNKAWDDIIEPINRTVLYTGSSIPSINKENDDSWLCADSSVQEGIKKCLQVLLYGDSPVLGERGGYTDKSTALMGNIAYNALDKFCNKSYNYVSDNKSIDQKSLKLFTLYLNYIKFKSWDSGNSSNKGSKVNRYYLRDAILEARNIDSLISEEDLKYRAICVVKKIIFRYLDNTKVADAMNK